MLNISLAILNFVNKIGDASLETEWFGQVQDAAGKVVKTVRWEGRPTNFAWDGRDEIGVKLADGQYGFNVASTDVAGNTGGAGLASIRMDTRQSPVSVRSEYRAFSPNNDDIKDRNTFLLDAVIQVRIYWNNDARGKIEEAEVLGPLSEKRAETVKKALMTLGIQENRMTIAGFGGTRPVVPHSDLENRWKNRRAEFLLRRD